MGKQNPQSIESYLQSEDVQERIRHSMLRNRSDVSVPISEAASLFGFGINQLRKWEDRGLLNPGREGKHRRYSLNDLDKLAIIHELIQAKFSSGSIPHDIDRIWNTISSSNDLSPRIAGRLANGARSPESEAGALYINQRIERAKNEELSRFYASFVMRILLQIICEEITGQGQTDVGLILPLRASMGTINDLNGVDDLPEVGECLVGWLAPNGPAHTFFTLSPSFQHPEQYRMYRLHELAENASQDVDVPANKTLLVVNWQQNSLHLNSVVVRTIERLLAPLYEEAEFTRVCFDQGMRDMFDPAEHYADFMLNGLADMIIRLGNSAGQHWRFCCILLPDDTMLPLQRRSLVVRAQSKNSPHKVGVSFVSPVDTTLSISLRAYQSGQTIYRPEICEEDKAIALRELEKPGSVIALPTGDTGGVPAAILYVASDQPHAFDLDSQRALRIVAGAVEEQLHIYNARQRTMENLPNMLSNPEYVDTFFKERKILSENDFVRDIEAILRNVQVQMGQKDLFPSATLLPGEGITIIPIDIDKQSQLASRFGDQFTRNLSKIVGSRLNDQLLRILTETVDYQLYHIWTDRFYLVVKGLDLEESRRHAERIRRRMKDSYEVSWLLPFDEKLINLALATTQVVPITVRVGALYYLYKKLRELLGRYAPINAVGNVRALIGRDIDQVLEKGRMQGGDVVMAWNPDPDPEKKGYIRWPPNASI